MKEKKKKLGLSWIVVALIFLFNPNLHLIDPLPDFLGYLFLCLAFSKLADLNEEIANSVSLFRKMIWIDAAKWGALYLTFSMSASAEKNSSVLVWTFVFFTLEMIFLLPAYTKLFYGIVKLGYSYPSSSILETKKKKQSYTDRAKKATLFFVVFKSAFTLLPEFLDLFNNTDSVDVGISRMYRYIGLLRGFSVVLVLIFGLVWLFRMQAYFRRIRHDGELISALGEAYQTKVVPKTGMFVLRRFQYAYFFLILGLILSMDYRFDNILLFPDIYSAIAFFFAFLCLSLNVFTKKRYWIVSSSAYFILSAVSYYFEDKFFSQYSLRDLLKNDMAKELYSTYVSLNVFKVLAFVLMMYCLYRMLNQVILIHTGMSFVQEQTDEHVLSMEKEFHKSLRRPLIWGRIWIVLYGISDICYDIFAPMLSGVYEKGENLPQDVEDSLASVSLYKDYYGALKTVNLLILIVCTIFFIRGLSLILAEIRTKYDLE